MLTMITRFEAGNCQRQWIIALSCTSDEAAGPSTSCPESSAARVEKDLSFMFWCMQQRFNVQLPPA